MLILFNYVYYYCKTYYHVFLAAINKLKYLYFQITKIRDNTIQTVSTKLNQTQMI